MGGRVLISHYNLLQCVLYYSSDGETVEVDAELVIGADGARSAIRNEMMKRPRYLQEKTPLLILVFFCQEL